MLMSALAMSQAEVDMLPPHQRAIFMQLVSYSFFLTRELTLVCRGLWYQGDKIYIANR